MLVSGLNGIGRHHQIVVNEFSRVRVVGVYAAHPGGRKDNDIRLLCFEKLIYRRLVNQVQFRPLPKQQVLEAVLLQASHHGAAHHAVVASDIDCLLFVHRCVNAGPAVATEFRRWRPRSGRAHFVPVGDRGVECVCQPER